MYENVYVFVIQCCKLEKYVHIFCYPSTLQSTIDSVDFDLGQTALYLRVATFLGLIFEKAVHHETHESNT